MQVVEDIDALRSARSVLKGRVGLVPTMGALHTGHISLVAQARAETDHVVATIFVNPTQFAANEDLSKYPRDLEGDLRKFNDAGVDLVFLPTPDLMYPEGFQTYVTVEQIAAGLEGEHRPGHFRGVATVVAKLFNLTQPDVAYFGQKDAQQVAVIRRMASDLNFPLDIAVCPTIREPDGLAMSSRNVYLSPEERAAAPVLFQALQAVQNAYDQGESCATMLQQVMSDVLDGQPLAKIQYVSVVNAHTLQPIACEAETPLLASLSVQFGNTRLIDNCLLPKSLNDPEALR